MILSVTGQLAFFPKWVPFSVFLIPVFDSFILFWDRVLVCIQLRLALNLLFSPGCPGTGLDPPAWVSRMLGLQILATMLGFFPSCTGQKLAQYWRDTVRADIICAQSKMRNGDEAGGIQFFIKCDSSSRYIISTLSSFPFVILLTCTFIREPLFCFLEYRSVYISY